MIKIDFKPKDEIYTQAVTTLQFLANKIIELYIRQELFYDFHHKKQLSIALKNGEAKIPALKAFIIAKKINKKAKIRTFDFFFAKENPSRLKVIDIVNYLMSLEKE